MKLIFMFLMCLFFVGQASSQTMPKPATEVPKSSVVPAAIITFPQLRIIAGDTIVSSDLVTDLGNQTSVEITKVEEVIAPVKLALTARGEVGYWVFENYMVAAQIDHTKILGLHLYRPGTRVRVGTITFTDPFLPDANEVYKIKIDSTILPRPLRFDFKIDSSGIFYGPR